MIRGALLAGWLLGACGKEGPDGGTVGDGGAQDGGTGETQEPPDIEVDVLIIGSGAAGMSAAWEADLAGASVLVVERDPQAGGAGMYARHLIAAGTRWQAEEGIKDSPDQMLAEWSDFTNGGDPEDPWVQLLADQSAETLEWLVDELGGQYEHMLMDGAAGRTQRLHSVGYDSYGPVQGIIEVLGDRVWTEAEAVSLRTDPTDPSRVAGAWVEDLVTGEQVQVAARATIIATGGFARDMGHVREVRPDLEGATLVYEARPGSDGGGRPLLSQVGAATQNEGNHGIYMHAIEDPRPTLAGEAVIMDRLETTVMVDLEGRRVADESTFQGFTLVDAMAAAPDRRVWALYSAPVYDQLLPMSMGAALGVALEPQLTRDDLITLGAATRVSSPAEVEEVTGIDAEGLQATLDRYADLVARGGDLDFGKRPEALVPLGTELVVVELVGGSAKSFGGAWLDLGARVLDPDGQAIPGLYAAGEAAGMLGTPAVAAGFSGSVTACYLTGRVAGRSAAAEALSAREQDAATAR